MANREKLSLYRKGLACAGFGLLAIAGANIEQQFNPETSENQAVYLGGCALLFTGGAIITGHNGREFFKEVRKKHRELQRIERKEGHSYLDVEPSGYRVGQLESIALKSNSRNLDELPIALASFGWFVNMQYEDNGDISLSMRNFGGSNRSSDVLTRELGIIEEESGELIEGYSVSGEGREQIVSYSGAPDEQFFAFVDRLHKLYPSR